jgi:glyoxylase-like metal-dependent hydrolase (beta-lactamase superfamily II)
MSVQVVRIEGDVMKVNAFVVHDRREAVVVDGMLTVSDARKVRSALDERALELAGVIVTHPHPDHYAGLAQIVGGDDVPVVATEEVAAVIHRDDAEKNAIVGPMMGDEWPQTRPFPNHLVRDGDAVTLGGIALRARALGPGESLADTIWQLDDTTMFAGDTAYNGMHAYLADGRCEDWLANIDRLERDLPDGVTLHVGHGPPGGKELLGAQRRYLDAFLGALERHAEAVAAGDHDPVVAEMRTLLPTDDLLFLLELSVAPALAALADRAR